MSYTHHTTFERGHLRFRSGPIAGFAPSRVVISFSPCPLFPPPGTKTGRHESCHFATGTRSASCPIPRIRVVTVFRTRMTLLSCFT